MGVFWVCYYHIVWSTKHRQPMITPEIETIIFKAAQQKSEQFQTTIECINTAADHLHVAVRIPPSLLVSVWVRDVKGFCTYEVNRTYPDLETTFRWQVGYSVLTFGKQALPFVKRYIEQQKTHHQMNTLEPYLEHLVDD